MYTRNANQRYNNNNNNNIYSFVTPLLASLKGAKANTESTGIIC